VLGSAIFDLPAYLELSLAATADCVESVNAITLDGLNGLSGHPKPANDGHLKTGQR